MRPGGEKMEASGCVINLISLSPITEDSVVSCLCERYRTEEYYTRAGSTLIALNPFKEVPHLYSSQTCFDVIQESCPHVYCTANEAYKCCQREYGNTNQSIIVSGESGAGKTVSAKHLLKYLTTVSQSVDTVREDSNEIEERILDSNPILEAFGNAMTVRNENSSRFGKYIQLQFQGNGQILGANLQTYLLEKTRVTHHSHRESNFHVFYQMLQGCTEEERACYHLDSMLSTDFTYTKHGLRNPVRDKELWHLLQESLSGIGVDSVQQNVIFQVLASLLHLGNTSFDTDEDDEDFCDISQHCLEETGCLSLVCQMLGLDRAQLVKAITHRQISASHARRKSVFHKPCTLKECENRRNCLAQLIYSQIFSWLVDFINETIEAPRYTKTIGILDIYGFESFQHNSLEQLCINYANEKLQQHFVQHFLKDLQDEYEKEALPWTFTNFEDNSACLQLLESNLSIFALLNEECSLNRVSDDFALSERLHGSLKESRHWSRPKNFMITPGFTIRHYAGCVDYTIMEMVDKNKDNIPPEFISLLQSSENMFVHMLFQDFETDAVGKKRKTVLSKFKGSLNSLMSLLEGTNAHYIRCIKPNKESLPNILDNLYIRKQLEACGVMETVKICKQGYPARFTYSDFLQRYSIMLREKSVDTNHAKCVSDHSDDNKENEIADDALDALYQKQLAIRTTPRKTATPKKRLRRRAGLSSDDHRRKCCATIMKNVFGAEELRRINYMNQFGRTKIFLKEDQYEQLEGLCSQSLGKYAQKIQGAWKNHKQRKHQKLLNAVLTIQALYRGWRARVWCRKLRKAVITIQRYYRLHLACKSPKTVITSGPSDNNVVEQHEKHLDGGGEAMKDGPHQLSVEELMLRKSQESNHEDHGFYFSVTFLDSMPGVISRRRMPRVPIRFHTRANTIVRNAHLISRKEFTCSLTDCLPEYDEVD